MNGSEHRGDGFGLSLGAEHLGFRITLSGEDGGLPCAFRREDRGLLGSLRGEDECTAITLGTHLLLHGVLDRQGRIDGLELHTADPNSPLTGRFIQHNPQLGIDVVAAGECLFKVEPTHNVTECGGGELFNSAEVVVDFVRCRPGVSHLEVDNGVDRHHEVVLRDHGLRRERHHLLPHVDERTHPVDKRHQNVQARAEGFVIFTEAFNHPGGGLRHNPHCTEQNHHNKNSNDQDEDQGNN